MAGKTRIGPLARAASYARNVQKEYAEWNADRNDNSNVGQFYGALLQGRRYDKKGKQK